MNRAARYAALLVLGHPSFQVVAETERLQLRPLAGGDLEFMAELLGSLDVMRLSLTGPLNPAQAAEVLDLFIRLYATQPLAEWGVIQKCTRQLIGICGFLWRSTETGGEWELAYQFLPEYWGQGFATEAACACRDLAFGLPGVQHIVALIEPENCRSIRVAEKIGLTRRFQTDVRRSPAWRYVLDRTQKT